MKIFILEDDENRIEGFKHAIKDSHDLTICRWLKDSPLISIKRGAYELFHPPYDLILLDHDLGGQQYVDSNEEETGYQFAKFIAAASKGIDETWIIVHSYNPEGAAAMVQVLRESGWRQTIKIPFSKQLLDYLETL